MKRLMVMLCFLGLLATTSCKNYDDGYGDGYGDGFDDGQQDYAQMVKRAVNFGFQFEAYAPGTKISFIKLADDDSSLAVYKDQLGIIRAIKYDDYDSSDSWWDNWWAQNNFFYGLTDNGDGTYSCNPGTCYEYFAVNPPAYVYNMTFEETDGGPKDLQLARAVLEEIEITNASLKLVDRFSLSEERSRQLAHLAFNWNKISNKRKMTEKDVNLFVKKTLGVDMHFFKEAMLEHFNDTSTQNNYNQLLKEAAKVNMTNPEHINTIVEQFFL